MKNIDTDYPSISRLPTGLHSLDMAVSWGDQIGYPVRTLTEVYGREHVGKSTLAYYLCGYLGNQLKPDGTMLICDFEGMDRDHLMRATPTFESTMHIIDAQDKKGKIRTHESMLDEITTGFSDENVVSGMIDSIGAILPIFEKEDDMEGGMGARRAIVVAKFARKACDALVTRKTPAVMFVTNHSHEAVGGGHGHQSSGGVTLKHLAQVRMFLRYSTADHIKSGDEVLAWCVEGQLEKLRYGGKGRKFKFFIIPGYGVRTRLSVVQDCVDLGLAERSATVKIGDKSFGYISKMVEADLAGDDKVFAPFYEALKK